MKNNWHEYLHNIRKVEFEIAFEEFEKKSFRNILELGAGDGFQSNLLIDYALNVVATDLDGNRLNKGIAENIKYMVCDAENIDEYFDNGSFDLVYSSNLFEHLPNPDKALKAIKKLVVKNGLVILIMPSVFWKFCHVLLHYPNKLLKKINKISIRELNRNKQSKILKKDIYIGNNLKKTIKSRARFLDLISWPNPHGISYSNFTEFIKFRKATWAKLFTNNNYKIVKIKKGPITSGYGFNFPKVRSMLFSIGLTSEYIYYIQPYE